MIKLYEGCWGVTRGGEKKGPFPEKSTLPYCYPFFFENMGWHEDGRRGGLYVDDPNDIIAVFATEAEAEAYLAGEKPAEAPKFPEVGSSFDFRPQEGAMTMITKEQARALNGHTPGPWRVGPVDDTVVTGPDRSEIAAIDGDYNEPELWPIMEANARLIAAAPDLLATVIALHERVERLTEAATVAAQELRVIAGMDLIAASAVAFNAARSLEAILKETTHD